MSKIGCETNCSRVLKREFVAHKLKKKMLTCSHISLHYIVRVYVYLQAADGCYSSVWWYGFHRRAALVDVDVVQ